MAQIQKGDTFADGQQVTGTRLNQLIDSATVLPNIITDQVNLTANTVATGDSFLVYDLSATALREATASDLLNSNIAVTTSSVTGGANSDILITPNDGTTITGATYSSSNGLTVVVSSSSHGLSVGQVITISGAGTGYNGTFRITASDTNTFTYVMSTAGTLIPASNVSCSYTKKATVKNTGNKVINNNLYVDGSVAISGSSNVIGSIVNDVNFTSTGAIKVPVGTTAQRPASPVAGQTRLNSTTGTLETYNGTIWSGSGDIASTKNTFTGTNDFTGGFKLDGTTGFSLYEISEQTFSFANNSADVWTSSTFTKPKNEIWVFELSFTISASGVFTGTVSARNSANVDLFVNRYAAGGSNVPFFGKWFSGVGTALTSETVKINTNAYFATNSAYTNKLTITKYKTATGNLIGGTTALTYTNSGTAVTVASTAHGLASGAYVNVFASNPLISGRYQITSTTIDSFTYANTTASGSGTCSYFA